jgi:hypothetical protein
VVSVMLEVHIDDQRTERGIDSFTVQTADVFLLFVFSSALTN